MELSLVWCIFGISIRLLLRKMKMPSLKNIHVLDPSYSTYEAIMRRQHILTLQDNLGHDVDYLKTPFPDNPSLSTYELIGCTQSLSGLGTNFMADARSIDFQTFSVESNILGLLKLPSLQHIHRTFTQNVAILSGIVTNDNSIWMETKANRLSQALDIIEHYMRMATSYTAIDIIGCQERLIDNGLKEYADL